MNQEYNGYTNYDTWLLSVNLDNEEWLNKMVDRIANGRGSPYEKAESLKEQIEELFSVEEYGIIKICDSFTLRDFNEIDFVDIIESHIEED